MPDIDAMTCSFGFIPTCRGEISGKDIRSSGVFVWNVIFPVKVSPVLWYAAIYIPAVIFPVSVSRSRV